MGRLGSRAAGLSIAQVAVRVKGVVRAIALDKVVLNCDKESLQGPGRLAQPGERCLHTAEVTGSIPVPPTIESTDFLAPELLHADLCDTPYLA